MPNGRPGDHPLTDITVHKTLTYSRKADALIRRIDKQFPAAGLWDLLYLLYREGKSLKREEADGEIPMAEFEAMLGEILETIQEAGETIAKKDVQKLLKEKHKEIEKRFKNTAVPTLIE